MPKVIRVSWKPGRADLNIQHLPTRVRQDVLKVDLAEFLSHYSLVEVENGSVVASLFLSVDIYNVQKVTGNKVGLFIHSLSNRPAVRKREQLP